MIRPSFAIVTMMMMLVSASLCVFFAISSVFVDGGEQLQVPFLVGDDKVDLIYELKKAEIIPTVIDTFDPLLTVSVSWADAEAEYGNTINPSKTQKEPKIKFIDSVSGLRSYKDDIPQLTIAMSDPDAPSRDNPEWSEICHWIATKVPLTDADEETDDSPSQLSKRLLDVMPFKPPGPPPKTGKHRYVFVALAPANGTTDTLHLRKPGDRQHWGFKHERDGLRLWAEEMGLEVVGANFIYAQNDEQ